MIYFHCTHSMITGISTSNLWGGEMMVMPISFQTQAKSCKLETFADGGETRTRNFHVQAMYLSAVNAQSNSFVLLIWNLTHGLHIAMQTPVHHFIYRKKTKRYADGVRKIKQSSIIHCVLEGSGQTENYHYGSISFGFSETMIANPRQYWDISSNKVRCLVSYCPVVKNSKNWYLWRDCSPQKFASRICLQSPSLCKICLLRTIAFNNKENLFVDVKQRLLGVS